MHDLSLWKELDFLSGMLFDLNMYLCHLPRFLSLWIVWATTLNYLKTFTDETFVRMGLEYRAKENKLSIPSRLDGYVPRKVPKGPA